MWRSKSAKTANTKLTRSPYFLAASILAYFLACKLVVFCSRNIFIHLDRGQSSLSSSSIKRLSIIVMADPPVSIPALGRHRFFSSGGTGDASRSHRRSFGPSAYYRLHITPRIDLRLSPIVIIASEHRAANIFQSNRGHPTVRITGNQILPTVTTHTTSAIIDEPIQ